jgi:dephospho-CoA kinase
MKKKIIKIGITGGIGSGKSLASNYLMSKGFYVIFADKIAKKLYKENKLLLKKLILEFGNGILDENGNLSIPNARKIIFSSKKNIKRVNNIVHPFVFKEFDRLIKKTKKNVIFVEAAIMFETGSYKNYDYILLIYANKENRIKRIMKRDNVSRKYAEKIINLQMDENLKAKKADFVIKNNYSINELYNNLDGFIKIIKKL